MQAIRSNNQADAAFWHKRTLRDVRYSVVIGGKTDMAAKRGNVAQ